MTDYANWTYQGALLARHMRGLPDTAHLLKTYPVPNSAATLGIGLLAVVMSWVVAAKLWLCLQLAVTFVAIRHLARTIDAANALWFVLPQAVFLSVNWWYGFVNFELGLAWVLLMASMLLRRVQGHPGDDWTLGVVLVLTFFTHMIPFAFCGLMLLFYVRQTKRWLALWQLLPSAILSAWYVAGRYLEAGNADGQAGMLETVKDYSAAFWAYKANSYFKSFGFVNPCNLSGSVALALTGKWLFLLMFVVNIVLAIALAWLMMREAFHTLQTRSDERFLWLAVLIFLPIFVLAPGAALGISDPGSRLLQTVLVLGIAMACRVDSTLLRIASTCGAALAILGLFLFVRVQSDPLSREAMTTDLPQAITRFSHVPFDDQDRFYRALDRQDYGQVVFPTGMFLSSAQAR